MADKADKKAAKRLVYTLSEEVTFGGETFTDLEYRAATGRDVRKGLNIPKLGDRYLALAIDLFEQPEDFFLSLPAGDFAAITDIIDGFFERRPRA